MKSINQKDLGDECLLIHESSTWQFKVGSANLALGTWLEIYEVGTWQFVVGTWHLALGSLKLALGTYTEEKNKLHCNVTPPLMPRAMVG